MIEKVESTRREVTLKRSNGTVVSVCDNGKYLTISISNIGGKKIFVGLSGYYEQAEVSNSFDIICEAFNDSIQASS